MIHNKITDLKPEFQPIVQWIITQASVTYKTIFRINETLREDAVQQAYYSQGRDPLQMVNIKRTTAGLWLIGENENKKIVTNVPHVSTEKGHGAGLAVDLVPVINGNMAWSAPEAVWQIIGKCVEDAKIQFKLTLTELNASIVWGGTWKGLHDTPHIELLKN